MEVHHAGIEAGCAAVKVEVPHADEAFVEHGADFVELGTEVFVPFEQGHVVVHAKVFYVLNVEVVFGHVGDHFTKGREHATWEDVFAHPSVARFFVHAADEVHEE